MTEPGASYAGLIREQLDEERRRGARLAQRGLTVMTTSATLVTLLFALAAFLMLDETTQLPRLTTYSIFAALCLFASAAVLGILTNMPVDYEEADELALRELVEADWEDEEPDASRRVALLWVTVTEAARKANGRKARLVIAALCSEVAAVVAITVAIVAASVTR